MTTDHDFGDPVSDVAGRVHVACSCGTEAVGWGVHDIVTGITAHLALVHLAEWLDNEILASPPSGTPQHH